MSLNATDVGSSKKIFPPMEPDVYPARLRGVVNTGLHAQPAFQGQEKPPAQELFLTWEFVDEYLLDEDGQPDESKPRNLSEHMPFHSLLSERAKSTQRYRTLDPDELHGGDWSSLIGRPAMITVTTSPGKGGTVWNNVASVAPMPKKQAAKLAELINVPLMFDFYSPDMEMWEKLPNFIKKRCQESLEYNGSKLMDLLIDRSDVDKKSLETTEVEIDENEAPF